MGKKDESPDILNSKIKMVRIELPHYGFSHSSSGDSSHKFIGRVRLLKKLRKLVEDSSDKTGVYLVTGDRGVGKTNLVNEVIKDTSLRDKSRFTETIKYLVILLLAVVGTNFVTQFCLQEIEKYYHIFWVVLSFISVSSFILLCYSKGYSQKYFKKKTILQVMDSIKFATKELTYLINPYNPDEKSQYILKIILVTYYTQIISFISKFNLFDSVEEGYISPIKAFVFYLCFIFAFMFWRFAKDKLHEYYQNNKKYEISENNIYDIESKIYIQIINLAFKCYTSLMLLFLPLMNIVGLWNVIPFNLEKLLMCIPFIMVIIFVCFWCFNCLNIKTIFQIIFFDTFFSPIINYIKKHNRLFLRINFGHKLKDDKDILRLITRTLSTEYGKYFRSFWRMLTWRIMSFSFLFIFAYLFSNYIEQKENDKPIIKSEFLEVPFHTIDKKITTKEEKKIYSTVEIKKKNIKIFRISNPLIILDSFASEVSNIIGIIPKFLLRNRKDINIEESKIIRILLLRDYFFWLTFILMYLFFVFLFSCYWITHLFVTHRIILRKLKKLNSDITHSTELENSINVNTGNVGTGINTKTKKLRNVADAKEIEKELQDILDDIQQIPVIMCRPNIVIVFDELDKVEPGDTNNLEKENLQTKASLFSIDATRERQTEILRIMSNMKYFLSTANAKFIFIAGREMFDIYLADVSERNNYIGSIFNAVILVPSFLTDHPTGKKGTPEESGIATLTEEFICRRLFPHDYLVENYDLKNYRIYLERLVLNEDVQNIKQEIKIIIDHIKDEEKKKIREKIVKMKIIKKIDKIIDNQNKKIRRVILKKIFDDYNQEIEQQIKKIIYKIINENKRRISNILARQNENIRYIEKISTEQYKEIPQKIKKMILEKRSEEILKIIAVLQQFVIYLAHVSKGAPKKIMQLFESFVELRETGKNRRSRPLAIYRYKNSQYFLTFSYYKQYTLGIVAYLITPIFYRLAESNIKEHSDKLLVSSLRFVDFLFKFHKNSFSWKHLDMSPEMLEVNRAPELKSVAVELLNYLSQVHINKSNFSLSEYKFNGLIANEIFAMAKTDEVFSALFSFSLDETLPLKKHYQDLLVKAEKEYRNDKTYNNYIDAISSLQGVLGDLHYYDDELEEAEAYYKKAVQALRENEDNKQMTLEELYVYVRNMLRLGIIYEKRKQYDFAYLTYGELCKRIIRERNIAFDRFDIGVELRKDNNDKVVFIQASSAKLLSIEERKFHENIDVCPMSASEKKVCDSLATLQPLYFKTISPEINDMLFKKMTYGGLKMLYLSFIAKFQILEQSHVGGITHNHLKQLDNEFQFLTFIIDHEEAKLLESEFYSRVADILYYKNSDLKELRYKKDKKNSSCTACEYYCKALSILLNKPYFNAPNKNTLVELLVASVAQLKNNYNVKYCTILARILSDWGNLFFSCDNRDKNEECYICGMTDCNTQRICYYCACYICDIYNCEKNNLETILKIYINYMNSESKEDIIETLVKRFYTENNFEKMEIALAMYSISSVAYRKASLYKRSAYQIYKILFLFKDYEIYRCNKSKDYIKRLSKQAIHYLWYANDDLNVLELNKHKKDFGKDTIDEIIPLKNLLVDSEITRIRVLVKELELKSDLTPNKLKDFYGLRITSPYRINYSIMARIYRLRLKTKVNYEAYQQLLEVLGKSKQEIKRKSFILEEKDYYEFASDNCKKVSKNIFGELFKNKKGEINTIEIFENLIADSIYCLTDIAQLSETMEETYLFPHSFLGSIHEHLSFWIRQFEAYELYKGKNTKIVGLLDQYLGEEWREQLSGYRENQRALSHYYKCLEMHNEGRAYHNMLDIMCYIKDDFNDRSYHFNIAEERHLIVNGVIDKKIDELKNIYKDSKLYKVENYFNDIQD